MGSMGPQKGVTAPPGPRQQVSEEPSLGKKAASRDGNDSSSRPSGSWNPSTSGEAIILAVLMCDQNHLDGLIGNEAWRLGTNRLLQQQQSNAR